MGDCLSELKVALQKVREEKPHLVDEGVNINELRTELLKLGVSYSCLEFGTVKQALKQFARKPERDLGFVQVAVKVPILSVIHPDAGGYPDYSLAEALYVGIYEVDPQGAHEKMYDLLEEVLLTDVFSIKEKRALFMPVNKNSWNEVQEVTIKFLENLTPDKRMIVCSSLAKSFFLLVQSFVRPHPQKSNSVEVIVKLQTKLLDLCPELQSSVRVI